MPLQTGAEIGILVNINRFTFAPDILLATGFCRESQIGRLAVKLVFMHSKG